MSESFFKNVLKSFVYAFKGIVQLFRAERNAKVHLFAAFLVVSAGFWFQLSRAEWCWIVLSIVIVFAAEGFNTAIEKTIDLLHPQRHPVAGQIKDLAAGAVLCCAIGAAVIGGLVFLPYLMA